MRFMQTADIVGNNAGFYSFNPCKSLVINILPPPHVGLIYWHPKKRILPFVIRLVCGFEVSEPQYSHVFYQN